MEASATTPASPWSRPDDAARQMQLDVMKRRATGMLALAAAPVGGGLAWTALGAAAAVLVVAIAARR